MPQKQEEQQVAAPEKDAPSSTADECKKINAACDLIIEKIKKKKRVQTNK